MSHRLIVDLTDDEYKTLTAEAKQTGQEIDKLIRKWLGQIRARQIQSATSPVRPLSKREISERLYRRGLTEHMPSGKPFSSEDEAKLLELADLLGQAGGKPASEMVIEDRGPY